MLAILGERCQSRTLWQGLQMQLASAKKRLGELSNKIAKGSALCSLPRNNTYAWVALHAGERWQRTRQGGLCVQLVREGDPRRRDFQQGRNDRHHRHH